MRPLLHPALLVLPLAACAPRADAPRGPNLVTITATDFAFGAPDTIPAGLTTFRMVNQGQEPHQAVIGGASGRSWEELERSMMAEGIPDWLTFPAGPGTVIGGDSSNATAVLEPGNYLILCFIPSPDGTMHVAKGMFRRLVVRPATAGAAGAAAAAEPDAHFTIRTSDYAFALSSPLVVGTHTIRVENTGPQLHEVAVEQLAPGKTLSDWQAWAAAGMKGMGPAKPIGGFIGPDKGKVGWFTITLTPGKYLLTCYVPDAKDQRPHIMHGMVQEVTVN